MIYDIYFEGLARIVPSYSLTGTDILYARLNYQEELAKVIKESPDDSFVMINTNTQEREVEQWMEKYGLREHLFYEMPYFVTNQNHLTLGRRLRLRVFKAKKVA